MNLLWLIGVVVGALFVIKTEWFLNTFGRVAWADHYLGMEGGTRLFYKLLGLFIIFISMMGVAGLLGNFILSIFGGLFKGFAPEPPPQQF